MNPLSYGGTPTIIIFYLSDVRWAIPASFVYFRPFLIKISTIQIEKSIGGVLGIRTRSRRIVGGDQTTEPIIIIIIFYLSNVRWAIEQNVFGGISIHFFEAKQELDRVIWRSNLLDPFDLRGIENVAL